MVWYSHLFQNFPQCVVIYTVQSSFDAQYWMLGASALGWPRGMVRGGRREEGSGWGTHVYLWRIHFDICQNQYKIVKVKNKINLKKRKLRYLDLKNHMQLHKSLKNRLSESYETLSLKYELTLQCPRPIHWLWKASVSNFVYFIWGIRREGWGRGRKKGRDREREWERRRLRLSPIIQTEPLDQSIPWSRHLLF